MTASRLFFHRFIGEKQLLKEENSSSNRISKQAEVIRSEKNGIIQSFMDYD